jgi:hypothetical protein
MHGVLSMSHGAHTHIGDSGAWRVLGTLAPDHQLAPTNAHCGPPPWVSGVLDFFMMGGMTKEAVHISGIEFPT